MTKAAVAPSTIPQPPVWNTNGEVAFRARVFEHFHGLITLGSPLQKFATIWPERVPIAREPAFREGTFWINVFDPLDPVSGLMDGYHAQDPTQCPRPVDLGYRSDWVLLRAHLRYLQRCDGGFLADGIADLLLNGRTAGIHSCVGHFQRGERAYKLRRVAAYAWWIVASLFIGSLAKVIISYVMAKHFHPLQGLEDAFCDAWNLLIESQ